jgi:hypothetical protein
MLSEAQLKDVCLYYGGHKQCRFLEQDDADWNKHFCKKLSPDKKDINIEVDKFIAEKKAQGLDLNRQHEPIGDNCSGFLPLTDLLQGYDVDT